MKVVLKTQVPHSTDTSFVEFKKEDIERSIPKRFEQQVENYPHRLAIKAKSIELTYTEVNQMANRIARSIIASGQKGAETVALLFEPGISMIAAILGVLKAGKIWVPLDPSHPLDRISYILADSQANLILSDHKNLSLTDTLLQKKHLLINVDEIDADSSGENLNLLIMPTASAHIIYTSGSTGQPKGVLHNHRLVLHNIRGHTNSFRIYSDDRISLFSSLSHQAGITDMFRALLNGATLLPFNLRKEGFVELAAWLIAEGITIYHSVPTVFRQFVNTLHGNEQFPQIRIIHLGGEPVLKHDVELYKQHFSSSCMLVVILGATEAPTFRQNFITRETPLIDDIVPVGYPVEEKEILLLDHHGQKIESNQVGEIAVRSRYLALGYWKKPKLTRKAFLPDPAGGDKMIYRTGDLGRMLPDGSLIYLGRKDNQVKIGGQRIEIAEIETALLETPQIKSCAVVAKENNLGDKYLAAYIVPHNLPPLTVSELQNHLRQKLPDYMIPAKFVILAEIPLLPNGKIDRKAFQYCDDASRPNLATAFVLPRDDLERRLKNIWEEILGIQPIGIKDNFFELGGNSLRAARLLTGVGKIFGKKLPLTALFHAPTIAQMAIILKADSTPSEPSPFSLIALRKQGSKPPFFCIPGNLGNVFTDLGLLAQLLGPDQPFYSLQDGLGNPVKIEDIASYYLSQIRSIQPEGIYFLGGVCSGGVIAFEIAQQLRDQGQDVALLAMIEPARRSINKSLAYSEITRFVSKGVMRRFRRNTNNGMEAKKVDQPTGSSRFKAAEIKTFTCLKMKLVANVWALRRHIPKAYEGQIDLFLTHQSFELQKDVRRGWSGLAKRGANIHLIPGSHNTITGTNETIIEPAHIRVLAEKLRSCINQAQQDSQKLVQFRG